ncbi:MAG: hypothetical protein GWO20_01995 [Candidatus Korarchaeota archaeon]|nr:hypothetical protein [Candidatus Korarchaeota archaeon]NIU84606.1 hypothetical protein [Candidatus Thorarchaeota archaeon]NIW12748.1 hypothetical protein [Candidatus Thorarchaeota archaeon]NIW50956.1 hypothetical protein [Candidatus Korarchaeota archaeon]
MALSRIELKEKNVKLEEKVTVCPSCLKFLVMQGAGKDAFIGRLDPSDLAQVVECDICGKKEAKFFVSPFDRGIKICEDCLEERGKKHNWARFKVVSNSKTEKCDICLLKGVKHLKKP